MKVVEVYLTIETPDDIETLESRLTHEVFKLLRRDEKLLGWQIGGQIDLFDPQDDIRGI
jgi:hypothetical protein